MEIIGRFLAWLKTLFKPKRLALRPVPEQKEHPFKLYVEAWKEVVKKPEGKIIVEFMERRTWVVATEQRPPRLLTKGQKITWQDQRDARLSVLLQIIREARENTLLAPDLYREQEFPAIASEMLEKADL